MFAAHRHPTLSHRLGRTLAAVAMALCVFTTSSAFAQESRLVASAPQRDEASEPRARLNVPLMVIGATLFVGSYAPSAAFATLGDWEASQSLVVPVAGPWMALADPDNKPLSKALLINSGVMQGVGALSMVLSLVVPSFSGSTTVRFGKNAVQISPSQLARDAYGLGAIGSF